MAKPKNNDIGDDVEDLLVEASVIADLAYAYACHVGFDKADPRQLTGREGNVMYWLVSQVSHRVDLARSACQRDREGPRR